MNSSVQKRVAQWMATLGVLTVALCSAGNASAATTKHTEKRKTLAIFIGQMPELEKKFFADCKDGKITQFSNLRACLIASGCTCPKQLVSEEKKFSAIAARLQKSEGRSLTAAEETTALRSRIQKKLAPAVSQEEIAIRTFETMHRELLTGGYSLECTDLRKVIKTGRFNCVSATLLYRYFLAKQGIKSRVVELPGHAMCRIYLDNGKKIDVEVTCPNWFRIKDRKEQQLAIEKRLANNTSFKNAQTREVTSVEAMAMVYYNRGVDALAAKNFELAEICNAKSVWLDPTNRVAEGNFLATLNNWSVHLGEKGKYHAAIDLLDAAMGYDASYKTFRINYVHLHYRLVQAHVEAGESAKAVALLKKAAKRLPNESYFPATIVSLEAYGRRR